MICITVLNYKKKMGNENALCSNVSQMILETILFDRKWFVWFTKYLM